MFLALGSNIGDRLDHLRKARGLLEKNINLTITKWSSVYETMAAGGPPQRNFLNAVALAQTKLFPETLMQVIKGVEGSGGRQRSIRWGPRTIDIDVLTYGNWQLNTPTLQAPHPRMTERSFVMFPLAEIAPEWVHPCEGASARRIICRMSVDVPTVVTGPEAWSL